MVVKKKYYVFCNEVSFVQDFVCYCLNWGESKWRLVQPFLGSE